MGSLWKVFRTLNAQVAAGEKIFKGAVCGFKGGYLYNWAEGDPGLSHPCLAIPDIDSNESGTSTNVVDNTLGDDGDLQCPVDFGREIHTYLLANDETAPITQAHIGGDAWGMDDQTVSASPGARSRLGTPWIVQGANAMSFRVGVYVELESGAGAGESALESSAVQFGAIFVRNLVVGNIADLAAYTVASSLLVNDAVLGVEDDVVALVGQTEEEENGFYVIGPVVAGVAALTRHPSFPVGAIMPNGLTFEIQAGTTYGGKTAKSFSTQAGGWTIGTHDPVFYPRTYTKTITLAAGTYTIGFGSTATPDEALMLWTTHNVQLTQNTHAGTAGTNKLEAPTASRVVGLVGTAVVVVNSIVDAGTVAGSDTATVDVLITNG